MRIADQFLQCVVYIYPDEQSAVEGQWAGGSGFLVHSDWGDGVQRFAGDFLVTNRHVIERIVDPVSKKPADPIIRVNRVDGSVDPIRTNRNRWRSHPEGDDISGLRFDGLSSEHELLAVNESAFLNLSVVSNHNIGIGDHVAMIGRLVGHDGKVRNSPTARFGSISMMPGDKFMNDFNHEQESFLVDCTSIPGFSGSPVFLMFPSTARSTEALLTSVNWLLGIDGMHGNDKEPVRTKDGEKSKEGLFVKANSGIAGVIPAWKITELLDRLK
jgi:hypothetical protein